MLSQVYRVCHLTVTHTSAMQACATTEACAMNHWVNRVYLRTLTRTPAYQACTETEACATFAFASYSDVFLATPVAPDFLGIFLRPNFLVECYPFASPPGHPPGDL